MPVRFDAATRALLERPFPAVLATVSPRGRPQATPVWYLLDGDHILVNTARGRAKLHNVETNPHVALTVVDPENMYRYVQVRGRVVRIDPASGARDIDRLSERYTGHPYDYRYGGGPADRVSLLIRPLSVTGMVRR